MKRRWCTVMAGSAFALGGLLFLTNLGMWATAQERNIIRASSQVIVSEAVEDEAPPVSPAKSTGPMSLDACIDLGFQHQPALDAARASLAAAQSGQRAVDRLIIPRLFRPDLSIRRQQACLGVTVQSAGLTQAEWDTRYAITRNFYTVQYIREQDKVISGVLTDLKKAYDRAYKIYKGGGKITKIDLEAIEINIGIIKGKKSQVDNGMDKALAALREAMGLSHDYPLEIAPVDLRALAVYVVQVPDKDREGKAIMRDDYRPVYKFDKNELIVSGIANRGEIVQASTAARIMDLEVQAQGKIRGWQGATFGMGSDPHATPIPQGIFNNEYRPGAIGIEIPPMLAGRKADREQRASDLSGRAGAVVDKTNNLVSLDVEAQYLKWKEAVTAVRDLSGIQQIARELPERARLLENDFTSSAVIQASITSIMVRTQLNDALHMHALALAGLERATAGAFRIYPIPTAAK